MYEADSHFREKNEKVALIAFSNQSSVYYTVASIPYLIIYIENVSVCSITQILSKVHNWFVQIHL